MKVLVSLNIPDEGIRLMEKEGIQVTKWTMDRPMTREELLQQTKVHDALLTTGNYRIDRDFIRQNTHLMGISQFAAGFDNIDLKAAAEFGMPIGNAPDAMTDATADIAFALLLSASRKMFYMHKTILAGEWGHFRPQAHLGQELKGKILGVFGLGKIGMELVQRCVGAYGMKVLYCNRSHNALAEERFGAQKVAWETLLQQSDVISVHCALTPETKGVFNAEAFAQMKPNAIFINTARGGVHVEEDLIAALQKGQLWGAGLDVTNPEPMAKDNPLLSMENVAITPHIGSATHEARNRMSVYAAQNLIALHKGLPMPYPIQ